MNRKDKLFDAIHPEAINALNNKAEELIKLVKQQDAPRPDEKNQLSDRHPSHIIHSKDIIGEIKMSYTNAFGDDLGFVFHSQQQRYGILGQAYGGLVKYAEEVQKQKRYCHVLSKKYLLANLKIWIEKRYKNDENDDFISFIEKRSEESIRQCEIWIPIPYTEIANDFSLGKVKIRRMTKEIIDGWFKTDTIVNDKELKTKIDKYKNDIRCKHQGFAAVVCECKAEPIKAKEIAFDLASDSLSVLRLFSPSSFSSRLICGAYEYGQNLVETRNVFILYPNNKEISESRELLDRGIHWKVPSNISQMLSDGEMSGLNEILLIDNKNDFQMKYYEALKIYSKQTLKRNPFDKILYILVALESILLRNDTEPIQQNLSERIAFTIANNVDDRKKIIKNIKDIYSIRSKYVHHASQSVEETDKLDEFLKIAWHMFVAMSKLIRLYETKDAYIDALNNLKLS